MFFRLMVCALIFSIALPTVLTAATSGCRVNVLESSSQAIVVDIAIDSTVVIQKQINQKWFTELSFPGCAYTDEIGLPRLPITCIVVGIPPEGTPKLNVVNVEQETKSLGQVVPVQQLKTNAAERTAENDIHSPVGTYDSWHPTPLVSLGEVGYIRDQRIAQVEIHPVQYNAQTQMTRLVHHLRFQIVFENSDVPIAMIATPKPGKESAAFESFFQKHLPNYDRAKTWRRMPAQSFTMAKMLASTTVTSYKLTVEGDGIYVVTGQDLANAGANLSEIDFRTLSLTNKGKLVPMLVEGEGDGVFDKDDRIIFIGEFNRGDNTYLSPYTLKNVYWLSWGGAPGLHFAEVSGHPATNDLERADAMSTCIHLERDDDFQPLMSFPDESLDHWFWLPMAMGAEHRFDLPVTEPIREGTATLRVAMRGLTYLAESPDHHVVAKLNGIKVGDAIWDNQAAFVLENTQVPATLLNQEDNVLTFEFPGDLGVELDRVLLNWIEFEYNRLFIAKKDTLCFQYPEYHRGTTKLTTIWGFSEPQVYIFDNSGRRIIDFITKKGKDSYAITFSNLAVADETYFVTAASRLRRVQNIEKYLSKDLKAVSNGADYIIITHADFMEQAIRLAQFRKSQGFRTFVAAIQSIYNDFSYGIYDPRAIRRFLTYAYANWASPAPTHVLLLGDSSYNFDKLVWDKNLKRRRKYPTYVPTMMVYTTSWGMCSSDNYFVCVNGDDFLPDMFIGRLPANTPDEARNMVDKIIGYESAPLLSEWRNRICLTTGNDEFFEYSAQYLYENLIPHRVNVSRLTTNPSSPYFGSTEELADIINDGTAILNYIGHGGGAAYSTSELFLLEDIDRLTNSDKYPIIFSLSCFVGYFDDPEDPSLAEKMLCATEKGVVGHFGSSAKAYLYGNFFLNNALFKEVFVNDHKLLGEVTTYAKLGMIFEAQAYWDHVKNYILLGDPATHIALTDENIDLDLGQHSLNPGDVLSVSGSVKDVSTGTIMLSVFNERDSLVVGKEVSFSDGRFSTDLFVLQEPYLSAWAEDGGRGTVRAYYCDGQRDGAGGATFYVLRPAISDVRVEPESPTHNQAIYFSAHVETSPKLGAEGIGEVRCLWSLNKAQWDTLSMERVSGNVYQTIAPLQQQEPLEIFYKIQATDASGEKILAETPIHSVKIRKRCNLFSRPDYVHIGGTKQVEVLVTVANLGETDAGPFNVRILELDVQLEGVDIGSPAYVPGLGAQKDTVVAIAWLGNPVGQHRIKVRIDADNQVQETTELDNSFTTEFLLVTTHSGTRGELLSADGNAAITIEPDGVDRNSSIEWRTVSNDIFDQAAAASDCEKVPLANSPWGVYNLVFADSNLVITKPFHIRFYYHRTDPATTKSAQQGFLKVFAWNPKLSSWIGIKTDVDEENGWVTAEVEGNYTNFALLSSQDDDPPKITVCFEGQHFVDGDYVSQTPTISIVFEDSSGLDITQQAISLEMDGRKLGQDEYAVLQHNHKRITSTYCPLLEAGEHSLVAGAVDINGNQASTRVNFSVTGVFTLTKLANHPNPFIDQTYITFELTDEAESVNIDIFTSSGRRIWSAEMVDIGGYVDAYVLSRYEDKLIWDGTDVDGDEVANGVYYMKFCAQKGDEKIERIEKIARLK